MRYFTSVVDALVTYQTAPSHQKRLVTDHVLRFMVKLPYLYKNGDLRHNPSDFEEIFNTMLLTLSQGGLDKFLDYLAKDDLDLIPENNQAITNKLVGLCNCILRRRCLDNHRKQKNHESLDACFSEDNSLTLADIIPDPLGRSPMNYLLQLERRDRLFELCQSELFQSVSLNNNPSVNLGSILLARYQEQSWQAIATHTGAQYGSITALFHRQKPFLRTVLQDIWEEQGIVG